MRLAWIVLAGIVALGCSKDDSSGGASCDQVKKTVTDCYDGFCAGAGATTAFCKCWVGGQDIDLRSCSCVPKNLDAVCTLIDPKKVDISKYNCSGASDAVSHVCNQ